MVPNVTDRGTSFKGALAYYLHDKKQDGEEATFTSDRIEWTTTRNFYKDDLDPEMAGRIMAATAMDQDRLKREAGIKASGQKSKGPVYAYSIAWHPDEAEQLNKAEMLKAAEQSLEAIGAEDRQAIIVCHNDEPQPHVHLIVNLVSQEDGRNLTVHADFNKLDNWALDYRRARGQEHLYTPARAQKAEAKEASKRGEDVEFVRGEKSVPRHMVADYERAKAANPKAAKRVLGRERRLDYELARESIEARKAFKQEFQDLDDRHEVRLAGINADSDQAIDRARDLVEKQFEPARVDLGRRHYRELQAFEKREERLFGKISNAVTAIANRRQIDPEGSRGLVEDAFNYMTDKNARADALAKLQRIDMRNLTKEQREELGAAKVRINSDRSALLSQAKVTYNADRLAILQRQAEKKKEIQAAWHKRADERSRAFDTVVRKAEAKRAASPEARAREQFNTAADRKPAQGQSRGGRSRRITD